MKVKIICLLISLFIFIIILFLSSESYAIPAFARQYKISCTTCHAPMPKLKPYGDEFAGNGFILKENLNSRDFIDAGDDLLFLNRYFPLAVRFDAFALYQNNKPVNNDLQTPWGVKLLSGGPLYKNIGYYFYFYFSESGEIAGIEDAYIHFDDVFKSELDVIVGQFQICDPLAKRELRLTYEDYPILTTRVGRSNVNLTYDRGLMLAYGIEKTKTDLIAMVVNGTGKGEAEGTYDTDNYKNVAFQLTQNVGDIFSIGGFVYYANAKDWLAIKNKVTYIGPNINTTVGPLELSAAYLLREDSNPEFLTTAPGKKITTEGGFFEFTYSPHLDRSRFFLTGLYNWVNSDLPIFEVIKKDQTGMSLTYHTATLLGTYWLVRNLRLNLEYTRDLENNLNRVVLGLISGF
jgi:hypothetical protein